TDWSAIAALYDRLMAIAPSPIVALNRAIAVAESEGPERGLGELAAITERDRLANYSFYSAALGELEFRCGRATAARKHLLTALNLARSEAERCFVERRLLRLDDQKPHENQSQE